MLKRDWLLHAALGLCVVLGVVIGLGIADYAEPVPRVIPYGNAAKAKADYEARRSASAPDDAVSWIGRVKRGSEQGTPEEGGDSSAKGENFHAALDLEAQWAAAAAGERVARLAVWQLFFGAFGIAAVAWSLYYTRVSLALSRQAVQAANRTADEAKESSERQLRAYVSIKTLVLKKVGDRRYEAQINYANSGQTPAYKIKICHASVVSSEPAFEPLEPEKTTGSRDLGPGTNFTTFVPITFDSSAKELAVLTRTAAFLSARAVKPSSRSLRPPSLPAASWRYATCWLPSQSL